MPSTDAASPVVTPGGAPVIGMSAPPAGSPVPAGGVRVRRLGRQVGGVVVAVAIWELVSLSGVITDQALASVPGTFRALGSHAGKLASAAGGTLEAWGVGLVIAAGAGVVAGTVVGRYRLAEAFTEVLVRMMRPLPSLALIPIAILVAGLGLKMTAGLVAFTSFWPVFINTRYGVRQVDNLLIDTARTLHLGRLNLLTKVILPAAAPLIASGFQVAISLALVVTISVELVGGTGGIGSFVLQAQQSGVVPTMYAGILVGGLVGWVLNSGFRVLVARLLPWANRTEGRT
ncbi:MAG: ABC transporter permease [Acidobacteriota bacterium]|nr:ABC transporter permease [Acidobacteriota bacterium]